MGIKEATISRLSNVPQDLFTGVVVIYIVRANQPPWILTASIYHQGYKDATNCNTEIRKHFNFFLGSSNVGSKDDFTDLFTPLTCLPIYALHTIAFELFFFSEVLSHTLLFRLKLGYGYAILLHWS